MRQSFVLFNGNDKKLILENATHPCPGCKRQDTVQLTRSEKNWIVFNRRIELPNSMRVRYECRKCRWKNETLPDDDPSFQIPTASCPNDYGHDMGRCCSSIMSSSSFMSATSSLYPGSIADANIYKKRASYGYL
ncbi:hypothetical protein INT47_001479 [Mucor saturninus]|uniref:Uncharacterized protein n=1 Tax=Mucor saturninus TaxID=64648 RepID=A0A8H7R027_9FUNG|nr:hypothetical protein INT47_001479 [Mucor saturninus]